jgi:predicted nucleic acid-binding protein
MYLLDTMVLSELRKKERNPNLTQWLADKADRELFVSVISLGEIARGIAQQERHNREFAKTLRLWFEKLLLLYKERILPVDIPIAKRWGELSVQAKNSGVDILLAATALEHGLTMVTRNEKHVRPAGLMIINPWHTL